MKPIFLTILLLFAGRVLAQAESTAKPLEPTPENKSARPSPNLHLEDWNKGMPPVPQPAGITIYFDYTKFFEWLLPKKHPKIPPECDPNYFLRDSITEPLIKKDTLSKQPPV